MSDEFIYHSDTPLDTLCRKVGRLARKDMGGYAVLLTTYDAKRQVVQVIVGDERAQRKVLEVLPTAEVEVL